MAASPLQTTQTSPLCAQPPELTIGTLSWLPTPALLTCGATCVALRALSRDNALWRERLAERFPGVVLKPGQSCYEAYVVACRRAVCDANISNGICIKTLAVQADVCGAQFHAVAVDRENIFLARGCRIERLDPYGAVIETLNGHAGEVSALASDGHTLVSASVCMPAFVFGERESSEVRIWNWDSNTVLARTYEGRISALALGDGKCFLGCIGTIKVLGIKEGDLIAEWPLDGYVSSLALDGGLLRYLGLHNFIPGQPPSNCMCSARPLTGEVFFRTEVKTFTGLGPDPRFALDDGRCFLQTTSRLHTIFINNFATGEHIGNLIHNRGCLDVPIHRFAVCGGRFISSFVGNRDTHSNGAIEVHDYEVLLVDAFRHLAAQIKSGDEPCITMAMDTFTTMSGEAACDLKNKIFGHLYQIQKREGVLERDNPRCGEFAFFGYNGLSSTPAHRAEAILQEVGCQGMEECDALVGRIVTQNQTVKEGLAADVAVALPRERVWQVVAIPSIQPPL